MFVEGWKLMKSIQFEEVSIVCLEGRETTEEEWNRQCVWRGPVSQCVFDYMSQLTIKKSFWYLQTSDRLENPCKSRYV